MARRSGLGRGLGALIPNETGGGEGSVLRELPVSQVVPNPHQPRRHFDEESLTELTASVPHDDLAFELFNLPIELLQVRSQVLDELSQRCG